jgi:DNA-directed RNA polymerase specialized sigma24 family protein
MTTKKSHVNEQKMLNVHNLHAGYGDYLLRCLRLYGVKPDDCEDARQDIYLRLLESDRDLSTVRTPRGFCAKIARDMAIDHMRKSGRTPTMEQSIIITGDGFSGDHPELDKIAFRKWGEITDNPNVTRIEQALELAEMYVCDELLEVTAYDLIADLLYGLTMEQVAEKHSVAKSTVTLWLRDWRTWIKESL